MSCGGRPDTFCQRRPEQLIVDNRRGAERWLKVRKGRLLTFYDIEHYQRMIAALARTLDLQAGIDAAIDAACWWPLG